MWSVAELFSRGVSPIEIQILTPTSVRLNVRVFSVCRSYKLTHLREPSYNPLHTSTPRLLTITSHSLVDRRPTRGSGLSHWDWFSVLRSIPDDPTVVPGSWVSPMVCWVMFSRWEQLLFTVSPLQILSKGLLVANTRAKVGRGVFFQEGGVFISFSFHAF